MILTYESQGRDERWIRNRIDRTITRKELTTERKNKDVKKKDKNLLHLQTLFHKKLLEYQ